MQSSNSSDALAMNIFCYPDLKNWNGICHLLKIKEFSDIEFGFKPKVLKIVKGNSESDKTEIDVYINKEIIAECKLTEADFTSKAKESVHAYKNFQNIFHIHKLPQNDKKYLNYQLIRNILAAKQHSCRFILFCDMRRPDLARSFYQTTRCIKDDYLDLRTNCEIIYWQDIAKVVGIELKQYLEEKYGIF